MKNGYLRDNPEVKHERSGAVSRSPCGWRSALLALLALGLAACQAVGPIGSNLGRRFTWYSYLSGDDIAKACSPGSRDRLRLVYNARWTEQTRAYELYPAAAGARLEVLVWPSGQGLTIAPGSGLQLEATRAGASLDAARWHELETALTRSDVWGPAPEGQFLRSDSFYWVVAACRGGVFHFNAFAAPDARFERLAFPELLFRADRSGVPVNRPRPLDLPPLGGVAQRDDGDRPTQIMVGRNGLDIARWFD